MSLRLVALVAVLSLVNAQNCAFNTIVINAGTNRFTGLTVGNAFGGGIIDVVASSGNAVDCQTSGTTVSGDTCTFSNMAGTAYGNTIVATCNMGTYTYTTTTLTPLDCTPNTGTATISPTHKFGETGVYTCPTGESCSVANCEATCDAGAVAPAVNCNPNCPLGNVVGQLVTTTTPGSDGSDCSGPLVSVDPFSPTCSVTQVVGYTCMNLPLSVTCAAPGGTAMITDTCTENVCTDVDLVMASPVAGLIGDPVNNDQCGTTVTLSVISDPACDVMCDQSAGYQAQTGRFECTNTAGGVVPDLSITACVPVDCPPFSTQVTLTNCVCDAGYTGAITYTGTAYSGTCTLIECNPYIFPTAPASIVSGDTDGCVGNDVLNINDVTCNVKCAPGYNDATGVVTCDFATTRQSTTPLTCTEKVCAAYNYGVGITGGTSNGCVNPQILRQATLPSCTLACAAGYTGVAGQLDCPNNLADGAAPMENIMCTENTCASYTLQPGELAAAPGCGSLGTVTGNTCTLTCDTGYTVGMGTVTCPSTANQGDPPNLTTDPACQRTCALHSCGTGYIPKAVMTTVCDVMNGCNDVDCCDAAACPADSTTPSTDATLNPPSCQCMSGFTGTADWDATATAWVHTCTGQCSNTFFAGCDQNVGSLVANPAGTACTGTGGCNAMGCPACQQSDCCVENTCTPPGTSFPAHVYGGMAGDQCTTVAACVPVTCADGYTGTPVIQCQNNGGPFSFNPGCIAADCPANASPPGTCNCDGGYRVTGGGNTNFDRTIRAWTHTCELTCAHSSFTQCLNNPGFKLADNPENIICPGTSGNVANDCTTAVCCRQTCDNTAFSCPATGFSLRGTPSTIECPIAGCDQATCCLALCDNTGFTGCQQAGFIDAPNQGSTACGDNTITSCTTALCCLSTTCGNIVCPAGTNAVSPVPSCGICNEGNCCQENVCQALTAGQFPEYIIAGGTACTSVSRCNPVACSAGFHPDPVAQLLCLADGGLFTATGCLENVCMSASVLNYLTASNPCTSVTTCGAVTCGPGFNNGGGVPTVSCNTDGGILTGNGCVPNVCTAPGADGIAQVTFAGPITCTTVTECGAIACARGFDSTGTPAIACLIPGAEFTATGCRSKTCNPPISNMVDGYSVAAPTCVRSPQCGLVSCNVGFSQTATPTIICPVSNGEFEYTGCSPVPCPLNATGIGCICDNGFVGTPEWNAATNSWTHTCTQTDCPANASPPGVCTCNAGYTGTPVFSGTAWTHTCTITTCPTNAINPPLCTCDSGFRGTPAWDAALGAWTHACIVGQQCGANSFANQNGICVCNNGYVLIGTVCSAVNCPVGSSPPGICTCTSGTPAPIWSGTAWTHVCGTGCAINSRLVNGVCLCNNGYRSVNSVCTPVTCPAGASPIGTCACPNNNPAPIWNAVTLSWTHVCSTVTCPVNSLLVNGACLCNNGYRMNTANTICNAVSCPTGASPVGICACPNNTPTPVWNSVTLSWTHVCSTVTCPLNAVLINGVCTCNNGYIMTNGICNAVSCPVGAAPPGFCTCAVAGSPTPFWNPTTNTWTHVCLVAPANIVPTATIPNAIVNVPAGTTVVSVPSFLTQVTGPEAIQTLTPTCTATNPQLFAIQPSLSIDRTLATAALAFTRAAATTVGSSIVTCSITDNGVPSLTKTVQFTVNFNGGVTALPCGSVTGSCLFTSPITVDINTPYQAAFLTNLPSPTGTTTACTPQNPNLFAVAPTISPAGVLAFTSGATPGTTTVTCTTSNVGTNVGTTYNYVINVARINNRWLRARVGNTINQFSSVNFGRAVLATTARANTIALLGISVKYICPPAACPAPATGATDLSQLQCPTTHQLRLAAGCTNVFRASDLVSILQNVAQDIIVDFDVVSNQVDGSAQKMMERETTQATLNNAITQCQTTGTNCDFTNFGVPIITGTNVALTPEVADIPPTVATSAPSSDDDIPYWVWLLVALGVLLCCCLLIAAYCCMKKKKNKTKEEHYKREQPPPVAARQDPSYYDSYRSGSSYDATSYSSSYIPETFIPGERVRAQYIDGAEYDGEVFAQAADGTYNIKWYDGSHSEGVPARQITKL